MIPWNSPPINSRFASIGKNQRDDTATDAGCLGVACHIPADSQIKKVAILKTSHKRVRENHRILSSLLVTINPTIYLHCTKSDDGGGGERVLWTAVQHIQLNQPATVIVIYACDRISSRDVLINKVKVMLSL